MKGIAFRIRPAPTASLTLCRRCSDAHTAAVCSWQPSASGRNQRPQAFHIGTTRVSLSSHLFHIRTTPVSPQFAPVSHQNHACLTKVAPVPKNTERVLHKPFGPLLQRIIHIESSRRPNRAH
jgi:hypothetical protein